MLNNIIDDIFVTTNKQEHKTSIIEMNESGGTGAGNTDLKKKVETGLFTKFFK
jgi:hypothetical protein